MTYVSTDPLVATLFAIGCRNSGAAVVLVISQQVFDLAIADDPDSPLSRKIGEDFNPIECAIQLAISPADFEARADLIVDVDLAIAVLDELGFTEISLRLASRNAVAAALRATHDKGQRLSLRQIEEFNARIRERTK